MAAPGTVIVAGGAGFLGGHVAKALAGGGWSVVGVDRSPEAVARHPAHPRYADMVRGDLARTDDIVALLEARQPDVWIHLAGPASVPRSFEAPLADFDAGMLPLSRVLEAVRRSGSATRVLLASSAAVYGEPDTLPVRETHALRPISPYGFHKVQQELLLDEYGQLHGLAVCKARMFSTYGPGLSQLAVWDITRRALAGDFTVFGSGGETRDYLFVEDVAEALRAVCDRAPFAGEAVNVASGRETRIVALAHAVYAALGTDRDPTLAAVSTRGDPTRWCADVSTLRSFSFAPRVTLDDGIARTVAWIRAHV